MAFFGLIGNDREMAATTYSDRKSASQEASDKRRARHRANATTTYRKGQAWEDAERERQDRPGRRRR